MVDIFSRFLEVTNNILWSYILIAMLIGFGLYFSFKLKFVQITHFSEMVSLISKGFNRKEKKKDSISPFQAFCLSAKTYRYRKLSWCSISNFNGYLAQYFGCGLSQLSEQLLVL